LLFGAGGLGLAFFFASFAREGGILLGKLGGDRVVAACGEGLAAKDAPACQQEALEGAMGL